MAKVLDWCSSEAVSGRMWDTDSCRSGYIQFPDRNSPMKHCTARSNWGRSSRSCTGWDRAGTGCSKVIESHTYSPMCSRWCFGSIRHTDKSEPMWDSSSVCFELLAD